MVPELQKAPKVLLAISQGFQERLFLRTGIVDFLTGSGARVIIASPNEDGRYKAYSGRNIDNMHFSLQLTRIVNLYANIRRLVLWKHNMEGAILNIKSNLSNKRPKLYTFAVALRKLPWKIRLIIDGYVTRSKKTRDLLDMVKPDLVVMASPGLHFIEAVLLNESVRKGIKVAVVGQSWDNFSTKGYVTPKPDLMICWGEKMRDEAIILQDFKPEKVTICGAPHFDVYHDLGKYGTRNEVFKKLGLDPNRPLIVYGTSPKVHGENEFDVVKRVSEWVRNSKDGGLFDMPLQLLVRLHPQQIIGYYSEDLNKYYELEDEHVKVDIPKMINGELALQIDESDYLRLPMLLSHASVVINGFSTFALDAVASGVPTICVAFDGDNSLDPKSSMRRYLDYIHIKGLLSSKGVRVVNNYDELYKAINDYLTYPELDLEGRKELLRTQVYKVDGKSAERIGTTLSNMLSLT